MEKDEKSAGMTRSPNRESRDRLYKMETLLSKIGHSRQTNRAQKKMTLMRALRMLPARWPIVIVWWMVVIAAVPQYESRIINGEDVAPGEIPYQVSLQHTRNSFHFCGGSILNERYVITAAHCVEDKIAADIIIVAGIVNLNHPYLGVTRTIEQIISHKEYNNNALNDIALIKVFTPFKSSGNIGFVTLPKQDEAVQQGTVARFSGFSQSKSEVLQQVTIYITDQEYCKNIFNTSPRNISDTNINICANTTNIRFWKGYSGGPLIAEGKLVGLVSCSRGFFYIVYSLMFTRVPLYIDWIEKNAV